MKRKIILIALALLAVVGCQGPLGPIRIPDADPVGATPATPAYRAQMYEVTNPPQTFPVDGNGVQTGAVVRFDFTEYDDGGLADLPNSRFVIPAGGDGLYDIGAWVSSVGATNCGAGLLEQVFISVNGGTVFVQDFERTVCTGVMDRQRSARWNQLLKAGDTVTVLWYVHTTGPKLTAQDARYSKFQIARISS